MNTLLVLIVWFALLVVCWPLALLVLIVAPLVCVVWLLLRLIGIGFSAVFALLRAILFLPARLLGHKG